MPTQRHVLTTSDPVAVVELGVTDRPSVRAFGVAAITPFGDRTAAF